MCFRPPAHMVCPNHEVVDLQPQKVTNPYLGSVANAYTISISPEPTVLTVFWIVFYPPPGHISYSPPIFHMSMSIISLFASPPLPPIPPGSGATVHLDNDPARRPPPLFYASLPCQAAQGVPRLSLLMTSLVQLPPLFHP